MFTSIERAPRRANAAVAPRADRVERQLARFRPEVQSPVRGLAARHPWLGDLAASFPALLFALAFPHARQDVRPALDAVLRGAPLARIATLADVPIWLRAFPPEAFKRVLPLLPDGPEFRRQIANHFPKSWRQAPRWLACVGEAYEVADEAFALWIAREMPPLPRRARGRRYKVSETDGVRRIGFWAWHCMRTDTLVGALGATRWIPEMAWAAAIDAQWAWRNAVEWMVYLGAEVIDDVWMTPATVNGYEFTPLRSIHDLKVEGKEMNNCVGGAAIDVWDDAQRYWSVRRDGVRVATASIKYLVHAPIPVLSELAGPHNAAAPNDVWRAARLWLMSAECDAHCRDLAPPIRLDKWRAFWKPYWLAKKRVPTWLPLTPKNGFYLNL